MDVSLLLMSKSLLPLAKPLGHRRQARDPDRRSPDDGVMHWGAEEGWEMIVTARKWGPW